MSRDKEIKEVLSVRLDPKLLRQLEDLVERSGVSKADFVERCLYVGLEDQKEYIESLERPLVGELVHALMNPKVLGAILAITGSDKRIDEVQMKIKDNIADKRRKGRASAQPALG